MSLGNFCHFVKVVDDMFAGLSHFMDRRKGLIGHHRAVGEKINFGEDQFPDLGHMFLPHVIGIATEPFSRFCDPDELCIVPSHDPNWFTNGESQFCVLNASMTT